MHIEKEFGDLVTGIIKKNLSPAAFQWIEEKAMLTREEKASTQLNISFASVPRITGKKLIEVTEKERGEINRLGAGCSFQDWSTDRLCRLWLLMQVDSTERTAYSNKIESLFKAAEMNELVALYSSLFIFAYPETWQLRCSEGIRTNIGSVLEAIMYDNPYPHKFLGEQAWNQMVLKAFFTDKDSNRIIGLDERSNKQLALILIDYAHERWAAHRSVNPHLWRLVAKYIDENSFPDIEKLFFNGDLKEKQAAALACSQSNYEPAKDLIDQDPYLRTVIQENKLNWNTL